MTEDEVIEALNILIEAFSEINKLFDVVFTK